MATSTKNVETVSDDGSLTLTSKSDGRVAVSLKYGGDAEQAIPEAQLLDTVLEYAHERGLRRQRKAKSATPRKRRAAANGAEAQVVL